MVVRELERDDYQAEAYEYPVALFNGPDGRILLAHCPKDYCRLELEEAETGRPLTASADRKPPDFFHSRLAASPGGKSLLSAGWVWHPWGTVECFNVAQALSNPHHFDDYGTVLSSLNPGMAEVSSACWLDDDYIAIAASDEPEKDDLAREAGPHLHRRGLVVCDVNKRNCLHAFQMDEPPGTITAIGRGHVLSLYRNPKLIDLTTGKVVHIWSELQSGLQDGSIVWGLEGDAKPPPMAYDAASGRFAIANGDTVTVIEFNRSELDSMMDRSHA